MEYKHYNALRSIAEPTEIEDDKARAKAKFDKLTENRIILGKVAPMVNKSYAKDLMARKDEDEKKVIFFVRNLR